MKLSFVSACGLLFLAGCTTTYGPPSFISGTGGYTDKMISPGVFEIESLVNVPSGPAKAAEYWHMRAKELCEGSPYEHNMKLTIKGVYRPTTYTGDYYWPIAVGSAKCTPAK